MTKPSHFDDSIAVTPLPTAQRCSGTRCEAITRREAQGRDDEQFKNNVSVALERIRGFGRELSRYPRHGRTEGRVPFQG